MLASLQTYLINLKSSVNCDEVTAIDKLQNEDKLALIILKKKQIWQFIQLYGQYLEIKDSLKELLNELKAIDLLLENEIKADLLKAFELGDREDIDSYLCASILQVYNHFQDLEKSLIPR